MRRILLILSLILALAVPSFAQDSGQFCVRSFEDRNANQTRDAGEPLLVTGIGADLLEANGIVVASALLADSPSAAQGVICFERLAPGQYTIQVTSAEYSATTPDTMTVTLVGGELPSVLEFGAQSITAVIDSQPDVLPADGPDWPRIATAGLAAVGALLVMQLLGLIIYLARFRRKPVPVAEVKADTGKFRRPADS